MTEPAEEAKPGRWSTAWTAARKAGWGSDADELVKLLTFVVVLVQESLPQRWLRRRPPSAIDAVRLHVHGDDQHTHVGHIRCTDGAVHSVREVIFGLHYRREVYVIAAETGDPVNVIASRCRTCGEETLSTELGESPLFALRRF